MCTHTLLWIITHSSYYSTPLYQTRCIRFPFFLTFNPLYQILCIRFPILTQVHLIKNKKKVTPSSERHLIPLYQILCIRFPIFFDVPSLIPDIMYKIPHFFLTFNPLYQILCIRFPILTQVHLIKNKKKVTPSSERHLIPPIPDIMYKIPHFF